MKDKRDITIWRIFIYSIFVLAIASVAIAGLSDCLQKWIEIDSVIISIFAVIIGVFEGKVNRIFNKEKKFLDFCIEVLDNVSSIVPNIIEEIVSCIEQQKDVGKLERNLSHNLLKHSVFKKEFNRFYIEFCEIINSYHAKQKDIVLINGTVNKLLQLKADLEFYISNTKYSILVGTKTSKDLIEKEKNNG